jgi:hypothetical protein
MRQDYNTQDRVQITLYLHRSLNHDQSCVGVSHRRMHVTLVIYRTLNFTKL